MNHELPHVKGLYVTSSAHMKRVLVNTRLLVQVNYLGHWLLARGLLAEQRRRRLQHKRSARRASAPAAAPGMLVLFLTACRIHGKTH